MSDRWPAWATEPIEVVDPDPSWSDRAEQLAIDLGQRLTSWLDGKVHHVGSTAVPGLAAKPVIDLMAPIVSGFPSEAVECILCDAGWQFVPAELDRRPWRRFYVLPEGARRTAHLHLVERQHIRWRQTLAFRDALRGQPHLVDAYATLKRDLAQRHRDDREAYTAAKTEFVQRVLTTSGNASEPMCGGSD
jgi:GrpB-like predicted nucleotidyltransferase (UPF0157 family)